MREKGAAISRKLLSGRRLYGALLFGGVAFASALFFAVAAPLPAAESPKEAAAASAEWASGTFRSFGPAQPLLAGRVSLSDEADDPGFRAALETELQRLRADLHDRQGWADPLSDGEPLRVYVARREGQGVARLGVRSIDRHRLAGATIEIDGTGLSSGEVLHRISRLYARATLAAYEAPDSNFLTEAAAESLSAREGDGDEDRQERVRIAVSATQMDLFHRPDTFGRFYVDEFARAAGPGALRGVWERSAQSGEEVLAVFQRSWTEATGEKEETLLLRSGARMYAAVESEAGPSRLGLSDLQGGALDAATPAMFSLRHRVFLPASDATFALRVAWPEGGAPAAAVVRYRDSALPPDIVFWAAGTTRTVPLSGVSRVDWIVSATAAGPPFAAIAAGVEPITGFPFSNVAPQAVAGPNGPRLLWTTTAHEGLAGWALFREEVVPDGHVVRTGPQILPSTHQAGESFRYAYVDPDTTPGTFYRYSVWAVTDDGLLAKAFSATLRTSD